MKKFLLVQFILSLLFIQKSFSQAEHVPGPMERKLTDSLCATLSRLDLSKVGNGKEAENVFMNTFMKQSDMFIDLANERHIQIDDQVAMHQLGLDIGKNLLKQKCDAFLKLAMKMADKTSGETLGGNTNGIFKRIETKGFNYIVVTDAGGSEKTFLWLRQFSGSEKFGSNILLLTGKKLKVNWREIEVYLPQAQGYYKVKEITSIDFL